MISAQEAQNTILERCCPIGTEIVPLGDSLHRFLYQEIVASINLPPFDNAAMDGFAILGDDSAGATTEKPVSLQVIGSLAAGTQKKITIRHGECVRIMTGAPVPEGADAVVPFEETLFAEGQVQMSSPVSKGAHLRRAGEDVKKGEQIFETGERITSRTIALLAALGIGSIKVFRKPRVKIISTGNELIRPGFPLSPGKIYNSNGPAISAALQELGIDPESPIVSPDSQKDLKRNLQNGLDGDILITVGGVSMGDYDLVPKILEEIGAKIIFHKVAIKPGKPFLFARFENKPIFSLPGNPVSALVVFDRFVRPALLKIMGARSFLRCRYTATVLKDLKGSEEREEYQRGIVTCREGKFFAQSAGPQGSAHLLPLARANAILMIPPSQKKISAGEKIEFEFFEETA